MSILIKNISIINEGSSFKGSVLISGEDIEDVLNANIPGYNETINKYSSSADRIIDGGDSILIPGIIDDQVHFREPGATHKGDIASESAAAVLGGVTSFMDMPNNNPPACTLDALEQKYETASRNSYANYSFYLGATNSNIDEIRKVDPEKICGIKVFMGSSTGNMLVDSEDALQKIFKEAPALIATHCEEESIIKANTERICGEWEKKPEGKEGIPFSEHPNIRSREGCIASSSKAIAMAEKYNTRLHILHISTAEEIEMLRKAKLVTDKITGEVCVHYLWFDDRDYDKYGYRIKCNPAIKHESDRDALRYAVRNSLVDAVATDHAPHLEKEKRNIYLKSPSGLPTIQHSLLIMLQLSEKGCFPITRVIDMMCHAPARCFRIKKRGFIRKGYKADLAIIEKKNYIVSKSNIAYKCGWSPFENEKFSYSVTTTFVNGIPVVENGKLTGEKSAERLLFNR